MGGSEQAKEGLRTRNPVQLFLVLIVRLHLHGILRGTYSYPCPLRQTYMT